MADMSALVTTENYAALLARMDAKINGIAQMFMADDPTNIPAGKTPVRFNVATSAWEVWSGTTWGPLASKYVITVDKADSLKDNGGTYRAANTGAVANTIPVRDSAGKLPGSITGDAATVDGKNSSDFATVAQGTKADNALAASSYTAADILTKIKTVDGTGSGLDADTVDGIQGAAIITTGNIGSQSVAYADEAANATTANNATTAGGKAINTLPVTNTIPVRGANLFTNELYSGTFNSLTSAGITISGLSLQQYGVVDVYVWAKLTTAVNAALTLELNGDTSGTNYLYEWGDQLVLEGETYSLQRLSAQARPEVAVLSGTSITGFVHIRLSLGSGMYCYGRSWSGTSATEPFRQTAFQWENTANVTQIKLFAADSKIIANGAKVVICRAA